MVVALPGTVAMSGTDAFSVSVTRDVPGQVLPNLNGYYVPEEIRELAQRYPVADRVGGVPFSMNVPEAASSTLLSRLTPLTAFLDQNHTGQKYVSIQQGIVARLPAERLPQFYDQISQAAAESLDTADLKPLVATFLRWGALAPSPFYTVTVPETNAHNPSMDIRVPPHDTSNAEKKFALASQVRDLYSSDDWSQVGEFLLQHPALAPLLLEAHPHLEEIFPEARTISLSLIPGYEEDEHPSLYADIITTSDPMVAFKQMERFEEEWWLDVLDSAGGYLRFSVEFA